MPKRLGDDPSPPNAKLPRLDSTYDSRQSQKNRDLSPPAPSPATKKRGAGGSSSRTGQACDRCKTRKIRCDDTQDGCLPCKQNHTECTTTDRITNRAQVRGHTETVEQEAAVLRQHVLDLEQQLRDNGIEAKPAPYDLSSRAPFPPWSQGGPEWAGTRASATSDERGQNMGADSATHEANIFALPSFKPERRGDNYLGVSSAEGSLSQVQGTRLSVFGMQVDLADFMSDTMENGGSKMSYPGLLASIFGKGQTSGTAPPSLPKTHDECSAWVLPYLVAINPWLPVIHKPDMLELMAKLYEPGFVPTAADTVIIHMVLAIIKYQTASRNHDHMQKTFEEQSFAHYHFALSLVPEITTNRTIRDLQGLTLICAHLRNFPQPGPGWMMVNWALIICIEQGLHRSNRAWTDKASQKSAHEIQLRRRVFWSLMLIHVVISGKLGRPMMLRSEDFDVDFPSDLDDNLPGEEPGCSFLTSISAFKLTQIYLDTFNSIYSVRQRGDYDRTIRWLDHQHQAWKDSLPESLRIGTQEADSLANKVFALWMQLAGGEIQLLIHHPAVCRSSSRTVIDANIDICRQASLQILDAVYRLMKLSSMDTTWINATTYIAAIFTLVFVYWDRRDHITSEDVARLGKDLHSCEEVLDAIGKPLGSGHKLRNRIKGIVEHGLSEIQRYLTEKTAGAAVADSDASKPSPNSTSNHSQSDGYDLQRHAVQPDGSASRHQQPSQLVHSYSDTSVDSAHGHSVYPGPVQNAFTNPSTQSPYEYDPYTDGNATYNVPPSSFNGRGTLPRGQDMYMYNQHMPNNYSQQQALGGPHSWQAFTESLRNGHGGQPPTQEFLHSAGALMALHGGDGISTASGSAPAAIADMNGGLGGPSIPPHSGDPMPNAMLHQQPWPMSAGYDVEPKFG